MAAAVVAPSPSSPGVLVAQAAGRRGAGDTHHRRHPGDDPAPAGRGRRAGRRRGDYEAAIAAYDEVLADQPDNVEAMTYKGWFQFQSGDGAGRGHPDRRRRGRPRLPGGPRALAVVFQRLGRPETALPELDRLDALARTRRPPSWTSLARPPRGAPGRPRPIRRTAPPPRPASRRRAARDLQLRRREVAGPGPAAVLPGRGPRSTPWATAAALDPGGGGLEDPQHVGDDVAVAAQRHGVVGVRSSSARDRASSPSGPSARRSSASTGTPSRSASGSSVCTQRTDGLLTSRVIPAEASVSAMALGLAAALVDSGRRSSGRATPSGCRRGRGGRRRAS